MLARFVSGANVRALNPHESTTRRGGVWRAARWDQRFLLLRLGQVVDHVGLVDYALVDPRTIRFGVSLSSYERMMVCSIL